MPSRIQSTRWCFTINNFTPQDEARLQDLKPKYLVYGRETGEGGTPHLQGFVIFERNITFHAAKTQIGPTAHIEKAEGTSAQASEYCKKQDPEPFEWGTCPAQGKRTDWDEFLKWVKDQETRVSRKDLILNFPKLWCRYSERLQEIADAHAPVPALVAGQPRDGWQRELVDELAGQPSERGIHFYVDEDGNSGKSWFCGYMLQENYDDVQILKTGKEADMCYAIDPTKKIYLLDVPRSRMEYLQYSVLEQLKDMMVFSTKYSSQMKVLSHRPHVVVMCNEMPDLEKLSADRYIIKEIN